MWYGPFSVFGPKERNNLLFHWLEQMTKLTNSFCKVSAYYAFGKKIFFIFSAKKLKIANTKKRDFITYCNGKKIFVFVLFWKSFTWNFLGVQKMTLSLSFIKITNLILGSLSLWLTAPLGLRHILILILEILVLHKKLMEAVKYCVQFSNGHFYQRTYNLLWLSLNINALYLAGFGGRMQQERQLNRCWLWP